MWKRYLQGFYNKNSRFQRNVLRKNDFPFEKVFFIVFGVWVISLSFCKIAQSGVPNHRSTCGEKKIGEINLRKICFLFLQKINFVFSAETTWTFSKTVRLDSQTRSLHVQTVIFRYFSGSKNICRKIFGHRTETSDFQRKGFLRLVKGAFQVSSATLREKDDKSKLYILWLV